MSTRPFLGQKTVISNGDMTSNLTSDPIILSLLTKATYQVVWNGTSPVGTVSIQGSNDYALFPNGTVGNAGTWTTLMVLYNGSTVSSVPISGNTGSGIIEIETAISAIRLVYGATSGTGLLNATINCKVA